MKITIKIIIGLFFVLVSCTSTEKLVYLNNLPDSNDINYFPVEIPDYKVQPRDILYISAKAMTPDGMIRDMLLGNQNVNQSAYIGNESSQYVMGYNIDEEGTIFVPVLGKLRVAGQTVDELRRFLQVECNKHFVETYVDCKLLSFKYTVLGEAKTPGTYMNYNNYLTVFEAIGRAGGVGDFGRRDRVLVIRATDKGSKTFRLNLQDKKLLSSEVYFLQPNDVIIIEPVKHKIFNMNLPTFSFVLASVTSTITTTLLLINFFGNK